ncbi:winged helix-turn-helix domain-containing protein [Paraburkholderia sp.]|uniref:winged helix-turn-helix domain-containing protein n=1 Tax=Paraburkholderia sp. TaxID=1926495 RepID=UPI00238484E2|nr:winged helix-turn-helix domain-containing protein [Paraburkholderia sp.]MDE1179245.1 winged helix-turn-helix domain-containing protein [Paraburkholderia sp.]
MIQIGPLDVLPDLRELRLNGEAIRIGSRAFEILLLLAEANGTLVSKDDIMRRVWPDTIVEENNLQVHISALRRALGDERDRIRTVPGRGYLLIRASGAERDASPDVGASAHASLPADAALWSAMHAANGTVAAAVTSAASNTSNASNAAAVAEAPHRLSHLQKLPPDTTPLIGRDDELAALTAALSVSQTVTLVGAGGIGKTRLAIEVARTLSSQFPDGVAFVSFAAVSEPQSALDALAIALGNKLSPAHVVLEQIAVEWRNRRALIVLDNCEQVLPVTAQIAEALVGASRDIRVLATSRESLRVRDEVVHQVPPLAVPSQDDAGSAVLLTSAVQLFLARSRAVDPRFSSDDVSVRLIGEVCRRLDGIPLALELAAARAAVLGIGLLAANLDDRFRILTGGRRTALPRHQTLKATLDWSYRLLDTTERKVLRWLGVFVNGFTFDGASQLLAAAGLSPMQVLDAVGGLVSKSLLTRELDGPASRYRFLETTRAYALQQLDANGERAAAASAHAGYFHGLFDRAKQNWTARPIGEWLADFRGELENLRSALDWTLSGHGDPAAGIELASVAVPYLFDLSLVEECAARARDALRAIDVVESHGDASASSPVSLDTRLRLVSALAAALVYTEGPSHATRDAWQDVLDRALAAGHGEYESRALWGLWNWHQYAGEPVVALAYARRFREQAIASGNATHTVIASRIEGIALHYTGDQRAARERLESMIDAYAQPLHRWNAIGFRIEHGIVAQATLARVVWAQGRHEEALALAVQCFDAAVRYDHEMVTCYVLVEALVPIALFNGDDLLARQGIDLLSQVSSRFNFAIWVASGSCYRACLDTIREPTPAALERFGLALAGLRDTHFVEPMTALQCQYALAALELGRHDEALASIDDAIHRCDATGERWYYAELCRVKGEVLRAMDRHADAQHWLIAALEHAERNDTRAFELRAATSVSRLPLDTMPIQGHA